MIHRGNIEMLEFTVHNKSKAAGKTILDLEKPKGAIIVAVKEGKEFVIPDVHTVLAVDDKVIVIVKKQYENHIRKLFE